MGATGMRETVERKGARQEATERERDINRACIHYAKRVGTFNAEACEYRRPLSACRALHASHASRTYLANIKLTTRSIWLTTRTLLSTFQLSRGYLPFALGYLPIPIGFVISINKELRVHALKPTLGFTRIP